MDIRDALIDQVIGDAEEGGYNWAVLLNGEQRGHGWAADPEVARRKAADLAAQVAAELESADGRA